MNLKSRLQRIESKLDSGICPLCGNDMRAQKVKDRESAHREYQRLIAEGWSDEQVRRIIMEGAPDLMQYLPSEIGSTG